MSCTYLTPDDIRAYKVNCQPIDLGACTDDDIQDAIDEQQEFLERITGDIFCENTATEYFDGNGECRILFPPKVPYKLLSVTSVSEKDCAGNWDVVATTDYTWSGRWLDKCCANTCNTGCGIATTPEHWIRGCNNIRVIGTWGWEETPKPILRALKLLVLEQLSPGSCSSCNAHKVPPNVQIVDWGDCKVTYQKNSADEFFKGFSTGIFEVDLILAKYINHVDMFVSL